MKKRIYNILIKLFFYVTTFLMTLQVAQAAGGNLQRTSQGGVSLPVVIGICVATAIITVVVVLLILQKSGRNRNHSQPELNASQPELHVVKGKPDKDHPDRDKMPRDRMDRDRARMSDKRTYSVDDSGVQYIIQLSAPNHPGMDWNFCVTKDIFIGRAESCEVQFEDMTVSKEQCKILVQDGTLLLRHLSETNSTKLNGSRVMESVPLCSGDEVEFGHEKLLVNSIQKISKKMDEEKTVREDEDEEEEDEEKTVRSS